MNHMQTTFNIHNNPMQTTFTTDMHIDAESQLNFAIPQTPKGDTSACRNLPNHTCTDSADLRYIPMHSHNTRDRYNWDDVLLRDNPDHNIPDSWRPELDPLANYHSKVTPHCQPYALGHRSTGRNDLTKDPNLHILDHQLQADHLWGFQQRNTKFQQPQRSRSMRLPLRWWKASCCAVVNITEMNTNDLIEDSECVYETDERMKFGNVCYRFKWNVVVSGSASKLNWASRHQHVIKEWIESR